jgi:beta-phosphoglucomutase-like phosphatase (HAD superfamily)
VHRDGPDFGALACIREGIGGPALRGPAIVSNNSAQAVRAHLERHALDGPIGTVVARTSPDPALLKPSPYLIDQAITAKNATP